jgi:hypothetical protein
LIIFLKIMSWTRFWCIPKQIDCRT